MAVYSHFRCKTRDLEDVGLSPLSEDPPEEAITTYPGLVAWKIPWTEDAGGLQSMGSQRGGHN